MTRDQARESARDILQIIPLVMRTVAAQLRSAGELPAPAHFGLLSLLSERPRTGKSPASNALVRFDGLGPRRDGCRDLAVGPTT